MKLIVPTAVVVGSLLVIGCAEDSGGDADRAASTEGTQASGRVRATGFDPTFGSAGFTASPLSATEHDRFLAVTVGADDRTYAAGFITAAGDQAMAVARYDAKGMLDPTFGTAGIASVNVATGGKTAEVARSVVVTTSGSVLIGGPIEKDPTASGDAAKDTDVAVVRFDPSGRPDRTFGTDGVARIDFGPGKATSATAYGGDSSWGLAAAGDKVVVFGSKVAADRTDADYVVAQLTAAGTLDASFGTGGTTVVDLKGAGDTARHATVQGDGRIIATGYSRGADGVVSPVLLRFTPDGALDPTFGTAGVANHAVLPGVAESYQVRQQGSGYVLSGYGRGADANEKVDMIVYRFTADGAWDRTFGTDGITRIDVAKQDDRSRNHIVLSDGRILVSGSGKKTAADVDAMLVLLSADGAPVTGFGEGGRLISDLGGPADAWFGITAGADGRSVLVAGYKGNEPTGGGNDDAVLARLTP